MDGVLSRDTYRRFKQVNRRDMEEIRKVKGIGKELAGRINSAVTGRFDNENDAESEGL